MTTNTTINESDLSENAQEKAHAQPDGNVVYARRNARGHVVFSLEPAQVDQAEHQGILIGAMKVKFGS